MALSDFCAEYGITQKFPEIAGTYTGGLVICADAQCIWRDLWFFGCEDNSGLGRVHKEGWHFMTVNKMVEVFPGKIEHAYSNQPNCLQRFVAARRDEYGHEFGGPKHTHSLSQGCDHVWPFGGHGTSGLGAALVGFALGYSRIVLCGMPLDDGPHNGEPPWRRTGFASSEAAGSVGYDRNVHWHRAKLAFEGKVRSMSGRTKKWLGDALEWV